MIKQLKNGFEWLAVVAILIICVSLLELAGMALFDGVFVLGRNKNCSRVTEIKTKNGDITITDTRPVYVCNF